MSIKDVIKNSVLSSFGGANTISLPQIILILAVSCIIGVYIYFIYKSFSRSAFYSKDMNITLAGMSIIVAAIMIAMQSNLLVSLGMVGALSIVRFRTAIKNPIDLLYLFWSISAGIICGVGLYALAIVSCVIMTLVIWLLGRVPTAKAPAVIIIRSSIETDVYEIEAIIKDFSKAFHKSSESIRNNERECIYEIKNGNQTELITEINSLGGIKSINWIEHDGEVRG